MLNFLGIGAQKAGTTWLYANLAKHPEISFPAGKELHFWDMNKQNGIDWYKNLFPDVSGKINGEITPAYAILDVSGILEVKAHFPDIKLIYITRNPIERAWSGALMALKRAEMKLNDASDQWFIDHFRSEGSRKRGDYAECLDNWLSVYPRESCKIMKYEEVMSAPREHLTDLARFLGIDDAFFSKISDDEYKTKHNEGDGYNLRTSLHRFLNEFYREPIRRLYEKYGIDYRV